VTYSAPTIHPTKRSLEPSRAERRARRTAGAAVVPVLTLLVLIAGALGVNYHRNYQIDAESDKRSRPFAHYSEEDLGAMTDGYRQERTAASQEVGVRRVETRERHHFQDKVDEFERVQRATRRIRDRSSELAQLESELAQLEAEQQIRSRDGSDAMVHLERMFRL
jgi:hypothetical protein